MDTKETLLDEPGTGPAVEDEGGLRLADADLETLIAEQLKRLNIATDRPGLQKTPRRIAESLRWLTKGYRTCVEDVLNDAVYEEPHDSMVLVKDIEIYSLCEHHMLPFFGKAHVAYIPNGKIMGLSKVARLVEVFARRFQVQERLTEQIAQSVWDTTQPQGVAVVVEAYHLCMMMRGVQKQNSKTLTSAMRGVFLEDHRTRDEFMRFVTSTHPPLS